MYIEQDIEKSQSPSHKSSLKSRSSSLKSSLKSQNYRLESTWVSSHRLESYSSDCSVHGRWINWWWWVHGDLFLLKTADVKAAIDARIVKHLRRLVADGVSSVTEMKMHLLHFVKELFNSKSLPDESNRRFFPTRPDISRLMYMERRKLLKGMVDELKLENPENFNFSQLYAETEEQNKHGDQLLGDELDQFRSVGSSLGSCLLNLSQFWNELGMYRIGKH